LPAKLIINAETLYTHANNEIHTQQHWKNHMRSHRLIVYGVLCSETVLQHCRFITR